MNVEWLQFFFSLNACIEWSNSNAIDFIYLFIFASVTCKCNQLKYKVIYKYKIFG